ncbi:hypothetical protein PLICRDRAFT_107357 [Plicaturopsis crispa FD-325 SS-3]|nr:hypothetical protein PLICRDRAFT_107357 [Plicaturopsis crispa FD-325 SS-3]
MAPHPLIGKPAPALTLPDSNGASYALTPGQNGIPIALFFYPKSGTYGCTKEACQFRDALAENVNFKDSKVTVVGVSPDPVEKQKAFVEKQKLTYPILSDDKGEARKAYSVGKSLFGDARVTFIIDSKGVVRDALDATLNFGAHAKFIEKWLVRLDAEAKGASTSGNAESPGDAAIRENPEEPAPAEAS